MRASLDNRQSSLVLAGIGQLENWRELPLTDLIVFLSFLSFFSETGGVNE